VPLVPEGRADDVIVSGLAAADAAASVRIADCVCTGELLSLTETVKLLEPLEVGAPEIVPVDDIERPAGS
jgi:hypothetical protein